MTQIDEIKLSDHELHALRILAGDEPPEGGAWVNACCEVLKGRGFATGLPYQITEAGEAYLERYHGID